MSPRIKAFVDENFRYRRFFILPPKPEIRGEKRKKQYILGTLLTFISEIICAREVIHIFPFPWRNNIP